MSHLSQKWEGQIPGQQRGGEVEKITLSAGQIDCCLREGGGDNEESDRENRGR